MDWVEGTMRKLGNAGGRSGSGVVNRQPVEAVLSIARTCNPWRDLTAEFGHL